MATTKKKASPASEPAAKSRTAATAKASKAGATAKKADAPVKKADAPVKKADAPVKKTDAPVKKAVKKTAAAAKKPAEPAEAGATPNKASAAADDVAAPEKKAAAGTAAKAPAKSRKKTTQTNPADAEPSGQPEAQDAAASSNNAPQVQSRFAESGPRFPDTEYAVVEKILVGFLRCEVGKVGLGRAVLGLSGGIDSAVSAAIAARALGPANVLGVMMPYQSSSPESLADAREVAASLGIETVVVEITRQIDEYFAHFPDASRLRRGNKMARERMTILYDHSAARSALVIGTSNKTELLLGYGTLYGDMASALNPIGDLYKSQVWGLARHLDLPASVIDKAPTADLWTGQTDETELGFSYHDVDRLLYRMIDERCDKDELVSLGFDAEFVDRISRMVRSSQFKRRLPVIAKLSARSIDTDFRYSRDWGL